MRVVVVDDEPLTRSYLQGLLREDFGVDVVAACANVPEARKAIAEHDPDALFLDIEMPGPTGLELAREADLAGRPLIVFVTAHQKYALDAFDVAPVDYVLKPADRLRCRRALARVQRVLSARATPGEGSTPASTRYVDRLFVKREERLVHLPIGDIDVIEAMGNYIKLRAQRMTYVLRVSISALESRLDPAAFVRTHKSFIVNLSRIRELIPISHGDYKVLLACGSSIPLSRVYRDRLQLFVVSAPAALMPG